MDKILAINTIKNVFSALGAKTSDSNYGVALLDKTSGEPKGLMGMSDLASVLGGIKRVDFRTFSGTEADLDQEGREPISYGYRAGWCNNNNTSVLPGLGYCFDLGMGFQIILDYNAKSKIRMRFRNGRNWETILVSNS